MMNFFLFVSCYRSTLRLFPHRPSEMFSMLRIKKDMILVTVECSVGVNMLIVLEVYLSLNN